jgi:hypothetical protein
MEARPRPVPLPQERENAPPSHAKPCDWMGGSRFGATGHTRWMFPLPGGEGQGEGGCFHKVFPQRSIPLKMAKGAGMGRGSPTRGAATTTSPQASPAANESDIATFGILTAFSMKPSRLELLKQQHRLPVRSCPQARAFR